MSELSSADHGTSPPRVRIPRQYNAAWDLIQRNLPVRAQKIAYIDDHGSYSYGDLAERVNRFGNVLAGIGLEARDHGRGHVGDERRVVGCRRAQL